ncbi:MAG: TolC family protein [bacterium]|nr:TolC family protein [bacterium]
MLLLSVLGSACTSPEKPASVRQAIRANGDRIPSATVRLDAPLDQPELPVLDGDATLMDYLTYAAFNNPGIEAAFNRWKAAVERVPQVRALPDPRFTYRNYIQEVETRVGPMQQAFGLSQTFPWLGKLGLRGDVAAEAARAARQQYEDEKLRLFFEVKDAYYEYYYIGRAIGVVQENLDLVEYLESVARARYKTAAAGHPDVIRAQVELGRLEDRLNSLRDLLVPEAARLNAALNRPTDTQIPLPKALLDERMAADTATILHWLAESSPQLKALDHEIERARHLVALAKKDYFPDLTFGVDYTDIGTPSRPGAQGLANPAALRSLSRLGSGTGDLLDVYSIGRSFSPGDRADDASKDVWMVSLSVNLPIWYSKLSAGEREARARYLAALSARCAKENTLISTVQRTLYEHRDAERKISLYRDTLIPKAQESIRSTETSFRAGSASFLDLVDAERSLLDFKLSYERALANRAQRLAALERLVGRSIPRESTSSGDSPAEAAGRDGADSDAVARRSDAELGVDRP